jgi:hypothetical protein
MAGRRLARSMSAGNANGTAAIPSRIKTGCPSRSPARVSGISPMLARARQSLLSRSRCMYRFNPRTPAAWAKRVSLRMPVSPHDRCHIPAIPICNTGVLARLHRFEVLCGHLCRYGQGGVRHAIASYIIANVRANNGAFVRAVSVAAVLAMPLWSSLDLVRQFAPNERTDPFTAQRSQNGKLGHTHELA